MSLETMEASYPPAARVVLDDAPEWISIPRQLQGKRLLITLRPLDDGETESPAIPLLAAGEAPERAA